MSMPALTVSPPTAEETRALERIREALQNPRRDNNASLMHALRDPVLVGFWRRVEESVVWHDAAKKRGDAPRGIVLE